MSVSAQLQQLVCARLGAAGALPFPLPIVERRTKELLAEIEAAAANQGLCLYVMPPLPTRTEEYVPFVMITGCEVCVRIIEQPARNMTGMDAWAMANEVMTALHWQAFPGVLSHPLFLTRRCVEWKEDDLYRIVDVNFNAVYGLQPRQAVQAFDALGLDVATIPDLQAAVALQLRASGHLSMAVPVIERRKQSLESDIEVAAANAVIGIEVLPERPMAAMEGVDFIFIEQAEVRVRIVEVPALNSGPMDAYDLAEDVMTALHGQTFGTRLPQPLRLAATPVEEVESEPGKRILEVIFLATHQLNE